MDILYLLIPLSLALLLPVGWAFWWMLRNGTFDDLESPSLRILLDDDSDSDGADRS